MEVVKWAAILVALLTTLGSIWYFFARALHNWSKDFAGGKTPDPDRPRRTPQRRQPNTPYRPPDRPRASVDDTGDGVSTLPESDGEGSQEEPEGDTPNRPRRRRR